MAEYVSPVDAIPRELGRRNPRIERGRWPQPFPQDDPRKAALIREAERVRVDEHLNPLDLLMGGIASPAMFMGGGAKFAPLSRIGHAMDLRAKGIPERATPYSAGPDIYSVTQGPRGEPGISFGKEGLPRWEIEDFMSFHPGIRAHLASIMDTGSSIRVPLGAIISDRELFANYPQLELISTTLTPQSTGKIRGGYSSRADPKDLRGASIDIEGDPMKMQSALAHEIQHAIQGMEGFARGGNPTHATFQAMKQLLPPLEKRLNRFEQEMVKRQPPMPTSTAPLKDFMAALERNDDWWRRVQGTPTYKEIAGNLRNTRDALHDPREQERLYERIAGEAEARNTQSRLDLDLLTRALLHPEETESVPRKIQLIRR